MSAGGKKYGLILPDNANSNKPIFEASRNVFGNDSESDDESNSKPVLLRPSHNINRQAKITQSKAIQEDPTIYQYDEIYDSMTNQKEEIKQKVKELKQPKYIENLLKTANKRKLENERRIERQVQKEREKEGDEFKDKEVFVTSAYKKKLEDLRLEEEKEQREEYLEKIGDVTKQRDLGGFYRHLYEQRLGSDKVLDKPVEPKDIHAEETFKSRQKPKTEDMKRSYRKRKLSDENDKNLSEGEIVDSDDEINRMNLVDIQSSKKPKQTEENIDADSDFSIDSSSEDEKTNEMEINTSKNTKKKAEKKHHNQKNTALIPEECTPPTQVEHNKEKSIEPTVEVVPPKPKIDIWKKRTVGEVFEQALKRYYERKACKG